MSSTILNFRGGIGGSTVAETISLFTKTWFYRVDRLKFIGWRQEIGVETGVMEVTEWLLNLSTNKEW